MQDLIVFIANIMEVDPSELTEDTAYGKFNKWDSLMHMRLVMEIEDKYGVNIPVDEIKTIKDFYKFIES